MGQNYSFIFTDALTAQAGGVKQSRLHFSVDEIMRAYEKIKPLAERLNVPVPIPRLAGFCYPHIASLGARIIFIDDAEPKPFPIISNPEEIDGLTEPENYLANPLIQERLKICAELRKRCPESPKTIGHTMEGPVTTAVLIMGEGFFTLPYDDPKRAHKLLDFSVRSAMNYHRIILEYFGDNVKPGTVFFPDDFAGMLPPALFAEFVMPYWEKVYATLLATERGLHSELLRLEHLPFLKQIKLDYYDPCADQYVTPEILHAHCPAKFYAEIHPWQIHDKSIKELQDFYRNIAEFKPHSIGFSMDKLEDEPKIKALLEVARTLSS